MENNMRDMSKFVRLSTSNKIAANKKFYLILIIFYRFIIEILKLKVEFSNLIIYSICIYFYSYSQNFSVHDWYLDWQWIFHSTLISPKIQKHAIFLKSTVYTLKSDLSTSQSHRLLEVYRSDFGVGTIGFRKRECFWIFL